jgi:DNA-directed RNA polymerase subunit L
VHATDFETLPGHYEVVIDEKNSAEERKFITTEHFRVRHISKGTYLSQAERDHLFPRNRKTNMHIDFITLQQALQAGVVTEELSLTCGFAVRSARDNQSYNVVNKCLVVDTIDKAKADAHFESLRQQWIQDPAMTPEKIEFERANYYLLDALRHTVPDSFDITMESIGTFDCRSLLRQACSILQNRLVDILEHIRKDSLPIFHSHSTTPNAYEVVLPNEDYTIGCILNWVLYDLFFNPDPSLSDDRPLNYIGFRKDHPDDQDSYLRIAFHRKEQASKEIIQKLLTDAIQHAEKNIRDVYHVIGHL